MSARASSTSTACMIRAAQRPAAVGNERQHQRVRTRRPARRTYNAARSKARRAELRIKACQAGLEPETHSVTPSVGATDFVGLATDPEADPRRRHRRVGCDRHAILENADGVGQHMNVDDAPARSRAWERVEEDRGLWASMRPSSSLSLASNDRAGRRSRQGFASADRASIASRIWRRRYGRPVARSWRASAAGQTAWRRLRLANCAKPSQKRAIGRMPHKKLFFVHYEAQGTGWARRSLGLP